MSVMDKRQEILRVGKTILWQYRDDFTTYFKFAYPYENEYTDFDNFKDTAITLKAWMERLYIANQLAWALTYEHKKKFEIERYEAGELEKVKSYDTATIKGMVEFIRELDSIAYNLISNGGRTFLSRYDEDVLKGITNRMKSRLVDMAEMGAK